MPFGTRFVHCRGRSLNQSFRRHFEMEMEKYRRRYLSELEEKIIPFWETHCPVREFGAYFTCLDRDGSVYDTEKFMWMQWRIVWMFSELYVKLRPEESWLDLAWNGYRFLTRCGKDAKGRYYFSLLRDGTPSMAPYNVFSECFACMGAAALYRATGDESVRVEAVSAFRQYVSRRDNPKGEWNKNLSPVRYQTLGFHMMQANMASIMKECLGDDSYEASLQKTSSYVFDTFWNRERSLMFENVREDGSFDLESMTGRQLNPGHALEAMWFLMDAAERRNDEASIRKAADIMLATLRNGWDEKYGGLFYFMDAAGKPHVELQHSMKLWWVHCEALIATLMAYRYTGRNEFREWFERLDEWTWAHFPDPEYGEWFAYLDRRGDVSSFLKGGKWKTFFHLPRMLLVCSELFAGTHH